MNDRWRDIEAIVDRVLSAVPTQRPTIIAEACAGDAELLGEVESLLKACEAAAGFLERPALAIDPLVTSREFHDVPVHLPERIAGFRIQRVLGVGGMGVVYVAEQDRPHRTVALKVIKPDLATASTLRRFEHEAEVLGRLHHPGIAQVYEAGTADGLNGLQPYFAMELIDGVPITTFASDHHLRTRDRLELLARVCDAVQHAHQQGVIHRDLKPSNLLVDSTGQPKILDFGVSRVSSIDGGTRTLQTHAGQIIGTLAYMSPEQASADSANVDTRSDVYSLGVLGYQLLCGRLPLDIGSRPIHESLRALHEEDPVPLGSVDTAFKGDIDTIIGKALQKDREGRYASAAEFAADIRRHLANEPVLARPQSAWYQITKFARRHKPLVWSGIAITATLLIAIMVLSKSLIDTRSARLVAIEQAQKAELERRNTTEQLARTTAALDFIKYMFDAIQPYQRGRDARLVDSLGGASIEIDPKFADKPAIAAELHLIVGNAYRSIEDWASADRHLHRALDLRSGSADAIPQLDFEISLALAGLDQSAGRYEQALGGFASAASTSKSLFGTADARTIRANLEQAKCLQALGRFAEAVTLARGALAAVGDSISLSDPLAVELRRFLAGDLWRQGQAAQAIQDLRDIVEEMVSSLGIDSPMTLENAAHWCSMCVLARDSGQIDDATLIEAMSRMRELVDAARASRTDADLSTQAAMLAFGSMLLRYGDAEEGLRLHHDGWQAQETLLGEGHSLPLMFRYAYAQGCLDLGHVDEALVALRRGVLVSEVALGPDHALTMRMRQALSAAEGAFDATDGDVAAARAVFATRKQQLGMNNVLTVQAAHEVMLLLQQRGRWLEAEQASVDLEAACAAAFGRDNDLTVGATVQRGVAMVMLGWNDRAEPILIRAYDRLRQVDTPLAQSMSASALQCLALICDTRGDTERATLYREALAKLPKPSSEPSK